MNAENSGPAAPDSGYLAKVLHVQRDRQPTAHDDSQMPYDTMNFVLHQIVPYNEIAGQKVLSSQYKLKDLIDQEFANVINTRVELHGCIMEGFDSPAYCARPKGADLSRLGREKNNIQKSPLLDFMLVATDMTVGYESETDVKFYINDELDQPGYAGMIIIDYNHPQHDFFKQEMGGKYYLFSEEVCKDFEKGLGDGFMAAEVPDERKKQMEFTLLNLGCPCSNWPNAAKAWLTRESQTGWPSKKLKEEISTKGCFLIPKSTKKAKSPEVAKILWQFAFPTAETMLGNTLKLTCHQIFDLLMLLREQCVKEASTLSNYMIKTLLFWMSEEIPESEWQPEGMAQLLIQALSKLDEYLQAEHFPHYFIPERNLLDDVTDEELKSLASFVKKSKQNPVEVLLQFCGAHIFQYHPASISMNDVMKPLQGDSLTDDVPAREEKRMQCLSNVAKHFYIEDSNAEADLLVQEIKKSTSCEDALRSLLSYINEMNTAVGLHEYLLQQYPESRWSGLYKGNLATLYFSQAMASSNESEKPQMMSKAKSLFEEVNQAPGGSSATSIDCINFLLKTKTAAADEVIPLLEKIIADERTNLQPENIATKRYLTEMKKSLPDEIMTELEKTAGAVSVPCLATAYYTMVNVGLHCICNRIN